MSSGAWMMVVAIALSLGALLFLMASMARSIANERSEDSDEKTEASLRRIEEKLGTLPADAPTPPEDSWKLPDTPQRVSG